MGTATAITVRGPEAAQFRGLFSDMRVVRFTVNVASLGSNAYDVTTVSVPGLDQTKDVVIGWTHTHTGGHTHEYIETFHTWTDELHMTAHNGGGNPVDPPSVDYTVVIGRLVA